ncbi:MAG: laccase domain-containing protein, partial [Proteobacteria bacterium]
MPRTLARSSLLDAISSLEYGFVSNHQPSGHAEHDDAEAKTATVKQVHQATLAWASELEKKARHADAIATIEPGLPVGVYSADCTPVLVAALDVKGQPLGVMAIHAGWRGTAQEIVAKAFMDFHARLGGQGPLTLKAVVGPCI